MLTSLHTRLLPTTNGINDFVISSLNKSYVFFVSKTATKESCSLRPGSKVCSEDMNDGVAKTRVG